MDYPTNLIIVGQVNNNAICDVISCVQIVHVKLNKRQISQILITLNAYLCLAAINFIL